MKRTRKIRITAIHRRVYKLQQRAIRAYCEDCGRDVETLAAAQAAAVLEVDAPALKRLVDEKLVHVIPTVTGSLLICQDSQFPSRSQ